MKQLWEILKWLAAFYIFTLRSEAPRWSFKIIILVAVSTDLAFNERHRPKSLPKIAARLLQSHCCWKESYAAISVQALGQSSRGGSRKLTEAGEIRLDKSLMMPVGTLGGEGRSIPRGTATADRSSMPKAHCPAGKRCVSSDRERSYLFVQLASLSGNWTPISCVTGGHGADEEGDAFVCFNNCHQDALDEGN